MRTLLFITLLCTTIGISAEELTLTVPELEPRLTTASELTFESNMAPVTETTHQWKPDFDFFKSKTNEGVKARKFMDDLTFVGIPLFVAGWAVKGDKAMFRVNQKAEQGGKRNTQLLTDFKTGVDDYTQFFGPAAVVGLKLAGVEGRSDWPRLMASSLMSYAIMAGFVNGIKYTAKEMRPDGSSANSWPSGHTATAFVGASLLHKEYGLTRSPWFSVAGYGVATATGVMRVLNNRHWISDVMSGAGIGIMSTELGYALCDLMFKGKGLLRNDMEIDTENPSFFAINMGLGLGSKDLDMGPEVGETIKFRAATVVDAEGAYFFNKYIGVGGRFRVRAMSAKSFGRYSENVYSEDWNAWLQMEDIYAAGRPADFPAAPAGTDPDEQYFNNTLNFFRNLHLIAPDEATFMNESPVTNIYGIVRSDHITEFTGSVGIYFNLPLSKYFSIGTKALIGRSITQDLDIDGHVEGNVKDINYDISVVNNPTNPSLSGLKVNNIDYPVNTGEKFVDEWEYLNIGASNSTSWGTGISLTYRYKSNFSWRLFCDYDYTEKTYTLTYDPYHFLNKGFTPMTYALMNIASDISGDLQPKKFQREKKMNYWTVGLSFLVNL